MKILLIGGNGTIGRHVKNHLAQKHEVIVAGRSSGDIQFDMSDAESIKQMFDELGRIDAVVSIAGEAKWAPFEYLSEEDFYVGIRSKLMGQVNLVRIGKEYLNPKGSFTLTTGILADDPVLNTTSAAMVNGAIHSFVRAAAIELKNGIRINAVAAGLVEDSYENYKDFFPGHSPVPMTKVVNGYVRSVEGPHTGEIIRVSS